MYDTFIRIHIWHIFICMYIIYENVCNKALYTMSCAMRDKYLFAFLDISATNLPRDRSIVPGQGWKRFCLHWRTGPQERQGHLGQWSDRWERGLWGRKSTFWVSFWSCWWRQSWKIIWRELGWNTPPNERKISLLKHKEILLIPGLVYATHATCVGSVCNPLTLFNCAHALVCFPRQVLAHFKNSLDERPGASIGSAAWPDWLPFSIYLTIYRCTWRIKPSPCWIAPFAVCFGSILSKPRFTTISAAFDFLDVDGTRKIRRNQFEPFLRPDIFSLLIPVSSRILLSPVWFWPHRFGFQWCMYSLETRWSSMGKWLFQLDDSTLLHLQWFFLFARKKTLNY